MKISQRTINILKNFSVINNSLLIEKGNLLETISREQNVIGQAYIEEKFPVTFAIYDLNVFLGAISLFKEPDLDFGPKSVNIINGNTSIEYVYTDPEMVSVLSDNIKKELKKLEKIKVSFKLNNENLQSLLKAGSTLSLSDFAIVGTKKGIKAIVFDAKTPNSNKFSVDLTEESGDFKYVFKFESLDRKFLPGNYEVNIFEQGESDAIGRFHHDSDLVYHIIVEDIVS